MCTSFFNVNCVRTRLRLWFQFSVKSASILYTSNCFSGKFSSFRWFSHLFFNLQQIYIKMLSAWIHLKRYIIHIHTCNIFQLVCVPYPYPYWAGPYRRHNYSLQNFIKHIFMMFMCPIQLISHVLLCITLDGKMEFIRIIWGATERTFARGYVVVFAICLQSIKITAVVVAKCSFGDISFVLLQSNMENPKTNTEHILETVFPFFQLFFFAQKLFHIQWASVETLFFFSLSRFHSRLNISYKLIRTYIV